MSEYLSDQGKRIHLLDYLSSMRDCIYDLSTELLSLQHGGLNEAELEATNMKACDAAMNLMGDMRMVAVMLADIYHEDTPVIDG